MKALSLTIHNSNVEVLRSRPRSRPNSKVKVIRSKMKISTQRSCHKKFSNEI
jgi:hypothetical protein